jgi:hypothetical protein
MGDGWDWFLVRVWNFVLIFGFCWTTTLVFCWTIIFVLCWTRTFVFYGTMSLKDRKRRPEGGGEWEPIKIHHRNLAYISNQTRRPSLLTRPGPHSYQSAIGPQTGLGTTVKTWINANKNTCKIDDKNQIKNSLYPHSHFTEHLVDAFEKSPRENNLNHESSSLIRWLKSYTGISLQQFPLKTKQINKSMHHSSKDNTAVERLNPFMRRWAQTRNKPLAPERRRLGDANQQSSELVAARKRRPREKNTARKRDTSTRARPSDWGVLAPWD